MRWRPIWSAAWPDFSALHAEIAAQRAAHAAGNVPAFIEADDRFHAAMAETAGQPQVWQDLERLKALEANDPDAAGAALRAHLLQMLDELPQMTAAHPANFTDAPERQAHDPHPLHR